MLGRKTSNDTSDADAMRSANTVLRVLGVALLLVVCVGVWQCLPPTAQLTNGQLSIRSGLYASAIAVDQIEEVTLLSSLPRTRGRTNGFEFGRTRRGRFASPGDSSVLLYVTAGNPPYIEVRTRTERLFLNLADAAQTESLFAQLVSARAQSESFARAIAYR